MANARHPGAARTTLWLSNATIASDATTRGASPFAAVTKSPSDAECAFLSIYPFRAGTRGNQTTTLDTTRHPRALATSNTSASAKAKVNRNLRLLLRPRPPAQHRAASQTPFSRTSPHRHGLRHIPQSGTGVPHHLRCATRPMPTLCLPQSARSSAPRTPAGSATDPLALPNPNFRQQLASPGSAQTRYRPTTLWHGMAHMSCLSVRRCKPSAHWHCCLFAPADHFSTRALTLPTVPAALPPPAVNAVAR
jgi:hypothetical protein